MPPSTARNMLSIARNCRALTWCMILCNRLLAFTSMYDIYPKSIDNILMWICKVCYVIGSRRLEICYLCLLFVGDDVRTTRLESHQQCYIISV
jgi:hypothetical protein